MNNSYLFYDIETTGLNKCFDQVIQFAAIRTDVNFNEIDRHEIWVKLNPDIIPSPQALITHQIDIQKMQEGFSEVEAVQKIHALFNTPGTISLGYNTLGFDDEFLRFSFYRNLLPPYTHQFQNLCSRMDLYPITVMNYLFNRHALSHWPQNGEKVSFKLAHLNEANQFVKGQAHNALVDVEATLALCRKLAAHEKIWNFLCGYFQKQTDLERLQNLPFTLSIADQEYQEGLLISGKLGYESNFQAPVLGLGYHYHYRNQILWLKLDDPRLLNTKIESIAENTWVFRKRLGEPPIILEAKPRFLKHLSSENRKIIDENRQYLVKNPTLFKAIKEYHCHYRYPIIENVDAEGLLYETDFPLPAEERAYQQFHLALPEKKEAIAKNFSDPIRRELAMRLLARHFTLSPENKIFYEDFLKQCESKDTAPINFRGEKRLMATEALAQIENLKKESIELTQQNLLINFEKYLKNKFSNIA